MGEEKKLVSLLNRSKRHYDTVDASDKAVRHSPGDVREYTAAQAAEFDPKEMVDLAKLFKSSNRDALRDENTALLAERESLRAQLAALAPKPEAVAEAAVEAPAESADKKRSKK